ncbi:MAG: hypothetical protein WCB58_13585 [Acidobacteriaceae bacterium]
MNPRLKHALVLLLVVVAPCFSIAQQSGVRSPVKGMASTVGLYVYPQKNQSATQQLTDEQQCYNSAKTQTGYDPNATSSAPKAKSKKSNDDRDVAKGAAHGAIISGATGGDAAAGARRGAIIGGIRSKREKKKDDEAKQKTEAKQTGQDKQKDDFKRATSACLDARGYSVR